MEKVRRYEGDGIVIRFEARRCIHAARCVKSLPGVFDAARRPWIDAHGASVDEIVDAVERCPSGALTYERTDGGPQESVPETVRVVTTQKDGPLYIRGAVEVVDHEGALITSQGRIALCRCGASKNKPFCDNSHQETGFSDAS